MRSVIVAVAIGLVALTVLATASQPGEQCIGALFSNSQNPFGPFEFGTRTATAANIASPSAFSRITDQYAAGWGLASAANYPQVTPHSSGGVTTHTGTGANSAKESVIRYVAPRREFVSVTGTVTDGYGEVTTVASRVVIRKGSTCYDNAKNVWGPHDGKSKTLQIDVGPITLFEGETLEFTTNSWDDGSSYDRYIWNFCVSSEVPTPDATAICVKDVFGTCTQPFGSYEFGSRIASAANINNPSAFTRINDHYVNGWGKAGTDYPQIHYAGSNGVTTHAQVGNTAIEESILRYVATAYESVTVTGTVTDVYGSTPVQNRVLVRRGATYEAPTSTIWGPHNGKATTLTLTGLTNIMLTPGQTIEFTLNNWDDGGSHDRYIWDVCVARTVLPEPTAAPGAQCIGALFSNTQNPFGPFEFGTRTATAANIASPSVFSRITDQYAAGWGLASAANYPQVTPHASGGVTTHTGTGANSAKESVIRYVAPRRELVSVIGTVTDGYGEFAITNRVVIRKGSTCYETASNVWGPYDGKSKTIHINVGPILLTEGETLEFTTNSWDDGSSYDRYIWNFCVSSEVPQVPEPNPTSICLKDVFTSCSHPFGPYEFGSRLASAANINNPSAFTRINDQFGAGWGKAGTNYPQCSLQANGVTTHAQVGDTAIEESILRYVATAHESVTVTGTVTDVYGSTPIQNRVLVRRGKTSESATSTIWGPHNGKATTLTLTGLTDIVLAPGDTIEFTLNNWDDGGSHDRYVWDVCVNNGTPQPPTPNPAICSGACLFRACTAGELVTVLVTGTTSDLLWGSGPFTDDSYVGSAAVHAGVVADGETKSVTVRCSGPQASFTSTVSNGITSKSFGEWPASFSFDLDGSTLAPPPPAPEVCRHEPCVHNRCPVQGTTLDLVVIGSTQGNAVWGTDSFTDDSSVGTAAVFMGLLAAGEQGSVTIVCTGSQSTWPGSSRNGVTTTTYDQFWQYSFQLRTGPATPPPSTSVTCHEACIVGKCPQGSALRLRVRGSTYGYGWGSGSAYTDDTHVGLAATHAGIVASGETAEVVATCDGSRASFTGTRANGITTSSYGAWPASFSLAAAPAATYTACVALCLHNVCSVQGRVYHLTVTGRTGGSLWGSSIYSDDSDPATAAVHSGLVAEGETKNVVATCTGPQSSFEGSLAHSVTSSTFGSWPASFTLESA